MEEIEEALTKLYISPFQSPTLEQRPTTVSFESPQVSRIEPSNDQLLNSNVNTLPIAEASLPNAHHNLTNNYALPPSAMTNQVSGHPRITSHVNFSTDLYGKITHPVDKNFIRNPIHGWIEYHQTISFHKISVTNKRLTATKRLPDIASPSAQM